MTPKDYIIIILMLMATYYMVGLICWASEIIPDSKDRRTAIWRRIIWPVVLLVVLSHKIGPFCVWFIKELRAAPFAIASALRLHEEK